MHWRRKTAASFCRIGMHIAEATPPRRWSAWRWIGEYLVMIGFAVLLVVVLVVLGETNLR